MNTEDQFDIIRNKLSQAMKDAKLSKTKVGEISGVSYQHIVRFMNNSRGGELGLGVLMRLAKALNVPVSYLLGETEPQYAEKWDKLLRQIQELPAAKQDKLHEIYLSILDGFK